MVQPMSQGETHDRAMNVSVDTNDIESAGEGLGIPLAIRVTHDLLIASVLHGVNSCN